VIKEGDKMKTKLFLASFILVLFVNLMVFAQNGLGDYALEFDGIDDYVTIGIPLVDHSHNMTVEAWFNTTNSGTFNSIATIEKKASGTNDYLQILTDPNGKVYLDDANDAPVIITAESYNDGKWHHVAFVRNTAIKTIYLYVDGDLKGTQTYTVSGPIDPDHELRFGNSEYTAGGANPNGSYLMDGMLDDIKVWDDVRTAEEIREYMYKDATGQPNLVGYYRMSNGTGLSLTDNSGNGNTGTLNNGPVWKASGALGGSKQALEFDGTNDCVESSLNGIATNTITRACAIKCVSPKLSLLNIRSDFFTKVNQNL